MIDGEEERPRDMRERKLDDESEGGKRDNNELRNGEKKGRGEGTRERK